MESSLQLNTNAHGQLNGLKSLAEFSSGQLRSVDFLRSLVNEIVIVSWVLIVIFWLARWQGVTDARRDAGQNSTLPVVALITPQKVCSGTQT